MENIFTSGINQLPALNKFTVRYNVAKLSIRSKAIDVNNFVSSAHARIKKSAFGALSYCRTFVEIQQT